VQAENEAQTSKVCPCNNPERPGEGGGFYVLAIRQQETVLIAGPFETHEEAIAPRCGCLATRMGRRPAPRRDMDLRANEESSIPAWALERATGDRKDVRLPQRSGSIVATFEGPSFRAVAALEG
jgi:hypothetical protein